MPTILAMRTSHSDVKPMSKMFATWQQLDASKGVDNITWETIEKACPPADTPEGTVSGWISDGTPLKTVLKDDWTTVQSLGTTHLELAAHLDAVYKLAQDAQCSDTGTHVSYDVKSLPGNTLKSAGPVALKIACLYSNGFQMDLLYPSDFSKAWSDEWIIDGRTGNAIGGDAPRDFLRVAGEDSAKGILSYVKNFGFYEGGSNNPYRLPPSRIVQILTADA